MVYLKEPITREKKGKCSTILMERCYIWSHSLKGRYLILCNPQHHVKKDLKSDRLNRAKIVVNSKMNEYQNKGLTTRNYELCTIQFYYNCIVSYYKKRFYKVHKWSQMDQISLYL